MISALTGTSNLSNEFVNQTITSNYTGTNGSIIGTSGFDVPDDTAPSAFLNLMFLPKDESITLDGESFAFDQIDGGAEQPVGYNVEKTPFDKLSIDNYEVPGEGYVIVYVSNEDNQLVNVHFDDIAVTLTQKEVVQKDDYYPFGLSFNRFRRTGVKPNKYLYQGKELLENTDWYDFHARGYHPALGRFMQLDPRYNGPSGYVGMLNNPVSTVDPNGENPVVAIAIGAAIAAVSYTASVALSDGGFYNWDWGDFAISVYVGAVSSGITYGIGTAFNTASTAAVEAGKETKAAVLQVSKVATHATFQGGLSAAQGGDFFTAFASGAVGGSIGLATNGLEPTFGNNAATVGSSMLVGGFTAEATGGKFWKGAAISGIVAGAGYVAHRITLSPSEKQDLVERREYRKLIKQLRGDQDVRPGPEFYYDALDGLVLNDGSVISRDELQLSFDENEKGNAKYLVFKDGKHHVNFNISDYEVTKANIRAIGVHEIYGHGIKQYNSRSNHYKAYFETIDSRYWESSTNQFKGHIVYTTWLTWSRNSSGAMPSTYMNAYYKYIKYHK